MSGIVGYIFLGLVIGVIIGGIVGWAVCNVRYQNERGELMASVSRYEESSRILQEEYNRYRSELPNLFNNLLAEHVERELNKKKDSLIQTSQTNLKTILDPLHEKLLGFDKSVASDREIIKHSIETFSDAHEAMRKNYQNLVNILSGDIKLQGQWGEIVLKRIFESAGMVEGVNYDLQKSITSSDDDGSRLRPDATVYLPYKKCLVIDAKCPSKYYLECVNNKENPSEFKASLKKFLDALKIHISDLSKRFYQMGDTTADSPDFVFLFLPVDGILHFATEHDNNILQHADKNKIAIVTPSTLLWNMRIVASLWMLEKQNRNTVEIIRMSSNMYDKFVLFVESLIKVGDGLQRARDGYDMAMSKLSHGSGNLIARAKKLKSYGIKTRKQDEILNEVQNLHGSVERLNVLPNDTSPNLLADTDEDSRDMDSGK